MYLETLCENLDEIKAGELNDEMGLVENATIAILPTKGKRSVIGMAFLLLPTEKDYATDCKHFGNVKEQGVRAEKDAYLYNVAIREKDRRKGNARKLLAAVEKEMKSRNKEKLVLFVEVENIGAIALYNNLGYKVTRAAPKGFLMEKCL